MQAGLPVVCFEADLASLYQVSNETVSEYVAEPALIVPRDDVQRWHYLMDGLIEDPEFRAQMGEAMRRRARTFDPQPVAAGFFDTLEEAFYRHVSAR
jgi:hypothetical protein